MKQKYNRSKRKRRKNYSSCLFVIIVLFAVVIIFLIAFGLFFGIGKFDNDSRNDTKKLTQETADTPIYILFLGLDKQEPAAADTIVLLSVNKEKEKLFVVSLPSNTGIVGKNGKDLTLLCDYYRTGGLPEIKNKVENLFHIFIPYYITINSTQFIDWIDERGYVGLYVEKDMYYQDKDYDDINLQQGYMDLNGKAALGYLRYKDSFYGDLERTQRQQRFMKQYVYDFQQQYAWINFLYTYKLWGLTTSNIDSTDAAQMAYAITNFPEEKISFYILPGETIEDENGIYWRADPIGAQNIIGIMLQDNLN